MTNSENPKPTGIRYEHGRHKKPTSYDIPRKIGAVVAIGLVGGLLTWRLAEIGDSNQPDQIRPSPSDTILPRPPQQPELPDNMTIPDPSEAPRFTQANNPVSIPYNFIHQKRI